MKSNLAFHIQQLCHCSENELSEITNLFEPFKLKKGAFFLKEGEVSGQVGFIEKGIVRYFILQDGEEKTYAFGSEGSFVSNYESLVPQTPSIAAIQCLEDTTMQVIFYHKLQILYDRLPKGNKIGRLIIEQAFIEALRDLHSFYTDLPEQRYLQFIAKHRDLEQRLAQYHIASYVGIKPQSLSRIRKRMLR